MNRLSEAKVKAVQSGDTLILQNVRNPGQERTLSLAFVSAPRLRREGDEIGAFESREFLRKLVVGKVIQFRTLYSVSSRDYGTVTLHSGQELLDVLIGEGWVKLRDDAERKDESLAAGVDSNLSVATKFRDMENAAKNAGKGLWDSSLVKIENVYEIGDISSFVETNKGKKIDSIVERVITGDRLICRLQVEPTRHIQIMILVGGIRAPNTKRTNPTDNTEIPADPYGAESQSFMEQRLLSRGVTVRPLGTTPTNQLVAEVVHPNGNIAVFSLHAGMARCNDLHSTMLGSAMATLRTAENQAKNQKLGVFSAITSTKTVAKDEIEAIVSRVFSADTIYLRNKSGEEKRVNLSSVRQPKPTDPTQSPFAAEAKEFLRKKLIGKHVKFSVDGKRPATEGYDEREMTTITSADKNVALLLVENGYVSVIRHRMDDPDRSPIYDELLAAEEEAKSKSKGMWNSIQPKKPELVDYSQSIDQAKRQLTILSRQKKVPAVVDFVKGGSRFTLLVPRENAKLTFVLSGISCPKSARNPGDQAEPFGQEAHDFSVRRCMQRDVEIDVENIDKVGGFIGSMFVNRESMAKSLVEEGLASVHQYSAEKSGNANELFAAEKRAKEARKNIWKDWTPDLDETETEEGYVNIGSNGGVKNDDTTTVERKKDYRDVVVTHIDPETARLKLQLIGSGTNELQNLMNSFRNFHLSSTTSLKDSPKVGEYVSAKFSEDGEWYRARVRRNDREAKTSEVVYFDYGNSETIPWSKLRPLDQTKFGAQKLKAQAVEAVLSFVQFSASSEYLKEAVHAIEDMTAGKQLVANVDYTDGKDGTLYVTLFEPKRSNKADDSINADMISEGVAMVPRKLRGWERGAVDVLASLKKREEEAKSERRGIWEYGDLTED